MTTDRYREGIDFLTRVQGERAAEAIETDLRRMSPRFADYSVSTTYGEVFGRAGLDLQTRMLVTIAILAAQGGCEPQLGVHVRGALRSGVESDAIVETIVQVGAYAGAARASNAIKVASVAFEKAGVEAG
jgi:4-carboxymuconolactone decarboxylase